MSEKRKASERIGHFFTAMTDSIYHGVASGPIGRLFTAYPSADRQFRHSAGMSLTELRHGGSKNRPLRRGLAQAVDHSYLRRAARVLTDGICRCSLRTLGAFALTTGLYCALITWLVSYVWQESTPSAFRLFGALSIVLVGVLLLLSNRSLGHVLESGVIAHWGLHGLFGFSEDALKDIPQEGIQHYAIAIPFGMLVGALCAFFDPARLLLLLVFAAIAALVLSVPEAGVILLLAYLPFYSFVSYGVLWLTLGAFFVLASYFVKLLRGTRVFRMEIQDLLVLLLLVHTCFLGISAGEGGFGGLVHLILLIALYFPIVNMFSAPHWMLRARWTLLLSATAAALVAIFQFVLAAVLAFQSGGAISAGVLGQAVKAGFSDHGTFAYFMVLVFPFSLHMFIRAKAHYRMPAGFVCVAIVAGVALSWVQSAWIAIAIELIVFFLLYERRFFPYLLFGLALSPGVWFLLPRAWRQAFGALMHSSADISSVRMGPATELAGRIFFEGGVGFFGRGAGILAMLFGLGHKGVETVAVLYTTQSTAQVISGFNFWLYRLLEGGLLGVLLPAMLFFFVLQNCFSLLRGAKSKERSVAPSIGVAMVFGALTVSCFRYTWHDSAAFLLFFVLIALLGADARARRAGEATVSVMPRSADCASLDYQLAPQVKLPKEKKKQPVQEIKQPSIEVPLDDPEALAIVEALIQEQQLKAGASEESQESAGGKAPGETVAAEQEKSEESGDEAATPSEQEPAGEPTPEVEIIDSKEAQEVMPDESEEE